MSLVFYDRIKETTTTTGTGTITLAGAVAGYRAFSTVGNLNTCYYLIEDTANSTWEVGLGTYTLSGATLSRSVISSSNSNSLVSFASGTKNVYLTVPSYLISNLIPNYAAPSGMRLTTQTGVPVSTGNRTSQGTIYYTPYVSDYLLIPNTGTTDFDVFSPGELSLSVTITAAKNRDVFVWNNGGTPTIAFSSDWTDDSTRADALGTLKGIKVNNATIGSMGAKRGIWVGTIRANGTNITEVSHTSSPSYQFVWNTYNRVPVPITVNPSATSWTYNSSTIRVADAGVSTLQLVCGDTCDLIDIGINLIYASGNGVIGIGVNSDTTFTSGSAANMQAGPGFVRYVGRPTLGFNFYYWLEYTLSSTTFYGDYAGLGLPGKSGVTIYWMA